MKNTQHIEGDVFWEIIDKIRKIASKQETSDPDKKELDNLLLKLDFLEDVPSDLPDLLENIVEGIISKARTKD